MNRGAIPGKTGSKGVPGLDPTPTLTELGIDKKLSSRAQPVAPRDAPDIGSAIVRVRWADGHVEEVPPARAARLLDGRAVELVGEHPPEVLRAIVEAHDARVSRNAGELARLGQLAPFNIESAPLDEGPMGRLARMQGGF